MGGMRRRLLAPIGLALLALAMTAGTATATTIYTHPFLTSFGAGASKSAEESTTPFGFLDHIAIDESNGDLYVMDTGHGVITRFDAAGNPLPFSALGPGVNSIRIQNLYGFADIAVDNSGTTTQGQIYVFGEGQPIHAFSPNGTELGGNFPLPAPGGSTCGAAVDPEGNLWLGQTGVGAIGYNSAGFPLNKVVAPGSGLCHFAINQGRDTALPALPTLGYFYIAPLYGGMMRAYDAEGNLKNEFEAGGSLGWTVNPFNGNILVNNGDHVSEWEPSTTGTPGAQLGTFGGPDPVHGFPEGMNPNCGGRGVAVNEETQRVYVTDCDQNFQFRIDVFAPGQPLIIPTVTIGGADVTSTTAILHGTATADGGGDTTGCRFEYGTSTGYGESIPCGTPSGPIHNADGVVPVTSEEIGFLEPGQVYHYRLVVTNSNGVTASPDRTFKPESPPGISDVFASDVNTDRAHLTGTIDPAGGDTRYHFEYGPTMAYGHSIPLPDFKLIDIHAPATVTQIISGLAPGGTYHYRLVASNALGTNASSDRTLTTFPEDVYDDHCGNAVVRRQTLTTLLLDCRAYELVSAANAAGYDVESDLIPGQLVLPAQPDAKDRLLYSLHHGKIPGIAGPTNLGLDPYVAARGPTGWTTSYVGIPTDGTPSDAPFGSPLAASDAGLTTFAFGGKDLCAPCFGDESTGIPVHLPGGSLVQGLQGSESPGSSAEPSGYVAKPLSADGSHLVFGSTAKFTSDGNSGGLTIYDRNLSTGTTHAVSKKPDSSGTMTGAGIGELDISADGSRILLGREVSTDSAGNTYWHLFMNIGDAAKTVDLMPSASAGALYAGMTEDGSKVFFVTPDKLLGSDGDNSADLYEAGIAADGTVTTELVSVGTGTGNTDACNPVATKKSAHWNRLGASAGCDVLAFAGGAGVASGNGAVYFLSPEKLDGQGTQDQPNLFVREPGGTPKFVATLEPDNPAIRNALENNETHSFGDIQVTPNGEDAAFASFAELTGFSSYGHSEIFRYDAPSGELDCVSCASTGAAPEGDASLSAYGLNLDDAGAVFFTSSDQLVLRDSNQKKDAYEWEDGTQQLISTGNAPYDSGMLSASADGVDAFFYTRQVLVPEDQNGAAMKVYDARKDGGFIYDPPPLPCQASDECHGPGSQAAPPPDIGTFKGTGGNLTPKPPTHHKKPPHHKKRHHHKRHARRSRG
jgi:hypothetical protein